MSQPRVVFAQDWLRTMRRGGERCLDAILPHYPGSPVLTLVQNPERLSERIRAHPVTTSYLQRIRAFRESRKKMLMLLFCPDAVRRLAPPACDVLVTFSSCAIKGLSVPLGARHLCYCFAPMRYIWDQYPSYFIGRRWLARAALPARWWLRRWDRATADRVHLFVGISRHVQEQIKRIYGRESELLHPPVRTDFYTPGAPGHDGFDLLVSAFEPYKRVDLAVTAYSRLGYPLTVISKVSRSLRSIAGPNIRFIDSADDEQVRDLYRRCRFLIFPGEEDFGLVPVEAQACGKPVIAYGRGGALDSVIDGQTGLFFPEQTEEALLHAVEEAAGRSWDPAAARRQAERFATEHFVTGLKALIERVARGESR